jgi:hypothetical protein
MICTGHRKQLQKKGLVMLIFMVLSITIIGQARGPERSSAVKPVSDTIQPDKLIGAPESEQIVAEDEYLEYEDYNDYEENDELFVADTAELRLTPDSIIKQLQSRPEFSYANDGSLIKKEVKVKKKPSVRSFFNKPAVQFIIITLAILLILFLLFRFTGLFKPAGKSSKEVEVSLEDRIELAIREKKYRDAIRLLFIQALQNLDEKNWIRFDSRTPNSIYRVQMKGKPGYDSFSLVTRIYEYVWYGEMEVDEPLFETAKAEFDKLKKLTG